MPSDTPAELGFRWPAEWEPHAATWVSWPHNRETWPGNFDVIPQQFADFVRTLAEYEPVRVLAGGEAVMRNARSLVGGVNNVTLHDIPTNDAWCRDHGPTFLVDATGQTAIVDWDYNAWGDKYPPFDKDNDVPARIAFEIDGPRYCPGIVLEGGSIEGNGDGLVLTTESCLLNPNRNPGCTREQIEATLIHHLAARRVVWLGEGEIAGDDTDGHVDQLVRFVDRSTVVVASESNTDDENYSPLLALKRQVTERTDLEAVLLPMPSPKFFQGRRLPASYCNFYVAKGVVIVPQFDDPMDGVAVAILRERFPGRDVRPLPALDIVWGLGAFHCLTQQQPAASLVVE